MSADEEATRRPVGETALPHYPDLKENLEVLRPTTAWGIAYRYPAPESEPEPLPETGEIERVIELLEGLASRLRALAGQGEELA
ncbi:MAG TPA: hypothetical protein VJR70_00055 [Stellaceae bacterium]|nr:hypothetical protein [Stellaceae bacterium]